MSLAKTEVTLVILAIAGVALFVAMKGFGGAAKAVTSAAVDTVSGAVAGTVVGVGNMAGVPDTSNTQCEIDISKRDYWAASFSCPAPRFLQYITTGK